MSKIIFVAAPATAVTPRYQPSTVTQPFPVYGASMTVPTTQYVHIPVQTYSPPPMEIVDPLDACMAWRARLGCEADEKFTRHERMFRITDENIRERFWTKQPIEDFIASLPEDVFFQRQEQGMIGWNICFQSKWCHTAFVDWYNVQKLGKWETVEVPDGLAADRVRDWIIANLGTHRVKMRPRPTFAVSAVFENDQDRMHFLLKWLHVDFAVEYAETT